MSLSLDVTKLPGPPRPQTTTPRELATQESRRAQARFHRQVVARDGNRCTSCRRTFQELSGVYPDLRMLIADHITPKTLGGTDDVENGQTLCFFCNRRWGWQARYKQGERTMTDEERTQAREAYFAQQETQ